MKSVLKANLYFIFLLIIFVGQASALTQINIYLDESGAAQFFGESSDKINLPEGVQLENSKIRGTTQTLTDKQNGAWYFNYRLDNSEIVVFLPERAVVDQHSSGEVFIDNERIAIYSTNSTSIKYHLEDIESNNSFYLILILIVIVVLYLYYKPKKKITKTDLKSIEGILHDRQNLIINRLKELGKVKMSYLRKHCGMPKASFSRHIQELYKKKVITISGEGKNKFVEINDKYLST